MKKVISAVLLTTAASWFNVSIAGGIPTFDGANISQSTITAINNVMRTLKQIEQYKTQLEQYENQLRNTAAPAVYVWDQANKTINDLRGAVDTLNYYRKQFGDIQGYLKKFQNVDYYRQSPCYTSTGCSAKELEEMRKTEREIQALQKVTTDAFFKGLEKQQTAIENDANKLQQLQQQAQSAGGMVQAIQATNQLMSHMSNQLLQMRSMALAINNVTATRNSVLADKEARQQAADSQAYKNTMVKSNLPAPRSW